MITGPNNTQLARLLAGSRIEGVRLAPGSRLEATVLPARPGDPPGSVTVRAGGLEIRLQGPLNLPAGSRVQLTVREAGRQPVFEITRLPEAASVAPPTRPAATSALPAPLRRLLAETLPQQQSLARSLAVMHSLATRPELPPDLREAVQRLMARLARPERLGQAEGLRQALAASGTTGEAAAAQGRTPPGDLKQALLALVARAERALGDTAGSPTTPAGESRGTLPARLPAPLPTSWPAAEPRLARSTPSDSAPPDARIRLLLDQAEAALARLRLLQAASLAQTSPGSERAQPHPAPPAVRHEIPLLWPDGSLGVLALVIERDPEEQTARHRRDARGWRVRLALDLPGLGPVQIEVRLQAARIGCRILAERPETAELFARHLDALADRLRRHDLVPGELSCVQGRVEGTPVFAEAGLRTEA